MARVGQWDMADFVAAITVKFKALAAECHVLLVTADNFDDAFKAAKKSWANIVQADQ